MQEAWTSPETYGTVLLTLFLDKFGMEALEWEPATIALEIEEEFKVDLPQLSLDRLLVAIQILTTDRFYKNLPDFIAFCNTLDGEEFNPNTFDPADAEEVAWGITEALMLSPPDDDDREPFSDEIRSYIGAVLDKEGLINAPDVLQIALRRARISPSIDDFADDPEMFSAVYSLEEGKKEDINQAIKLKLQLLIAQLSALDLKNGNTAEVVAMLKNT
jgi:hypothetical protein